MADPLRSTSSGDLHLPGATVTITLPAGVQATDVVVVMFGSSRATTINPNVVTAPAGWTQIAAGPVDDNGTSELELNGFWALGNIANLDFTNSFPLLLDQGWICAAFVGIDNTTPIDAVGTPSHANSQGQGPTYSLTLTIGAVTVVSNGGWEVFGLADLYKNRFTASGFTALENGTPATNQTAAILYNPTPLPPGSTGTATAASLPLTGAGQVLCGMPFVLRPDTTNVDLLGQTVSVAQGSVGVSADSALSGQSASVGQGSMTTGLTIALTGLGISAVQGDVGSNQPPIGPVSAVGSLASYIPIP